MGPLEGVKVLEIAGIGPAPVCGMLLADLGAEVITVERKRKRSGPMDAPGVVVNRGKRSIALDLKRPGATDVVRRLADGADALIEGFRPGVMERLGLGPDELMASNPALVYGRLSGWGQTGPLSQKAGHDINFAALSGALHATGRADSPPISTPTVVGDLGGGTMLLAVGLLAGIISARTTGKGQVVDAAVSDGAALMTTLLWELKAAGAWGPKRESNLFDGGASWYDTYECADGRYLSVGALEPQFFANLVEGLGLAGDPLFEQQFDPARWPEQTKRFAAVFATKTRDEWCAHFDSVDACVAPVLNLEEAKKHPHNVERAMFTEVAGVPQPSPAPRFSETPAGIRRVPPAGGENGNELLAEAGFTPPEIGKLREDGVV